MTAFLLARDSSIDIEGQAIPVREYWTGRHGYNGGPSRTPFKADALHFPRYDIALAVANTHAGLRNSDEWKVVRR